jgi:hypothetical protein
MYWIYENILCYVRIEETDNSIPLYRFWDGNFHRYTIDISIIPNPLTSAKVIAYLSIHTGRGLVPLYHMVNLVKGNSILCTEEQIPKKEDEGYEDPVLLGYVQKEESDDKCPLYEAINYHISDYFYTFDGSELDQKGALIKRLLNDNVQDPDYYQPVLNNKGIEVDLIDILDYSLLGMAPNDLKPIIFDDYYYCPSEKVAKRIIADCKVSKRQYISQVFDCEDFVHMLKTAFIEDAYEFGNKTLPYCVGFATGKNNENKYHAVNIIVVNNGSSFRLKIVDPQIGILLDPDPSIIHDIELIMF